jgi:hypothetical protein
MRRFYRSSWIALLVVLVGCGKTSQIAKPDAAVHDTGGTKADGAPDTGVVQPDVGSSDLRADSSNADMGSAIPDASVADAGEVRSDARKANLDVPSDGSEADGVLIKPDGAVDAPPPPSDGSKGDVTPDGRPLDTGALDGGAGNDEILRLCARAASCDSYGTVTSPSKCVAELAKTASRPNDIVLDHLLGCASAKDCSEFVACWGGELFSLDPVVFYAECDGNAVTLTPRGTSRPLQLDCSKLGGTCAVMATSANSAGCNVFPCTGTDMVASSCNGTVVRGCGGWAEYISLDCARTGQVCRMDGSHAICAGSGAACGDSDKVTCSGSVATYCSGGARATIDCAKNRFASRCAAGAAPTEPCAVAGAECDPASYVGACDGSAMSMCVNGYVVSVDCHDLGLVSCAVPATGGYASCRQGV